MTKELEAKSERTWRPNPGPQTEAFQYGFVDEILYGGAKGGGKTDWLLFDFLKPEYTCNPNYRGIIFRRTYPRLREIIDRSHKWFASQAHYNKNERFWEWPSGIKLFFAHCQYEESKYDYQGHEYHYQGFDQLEEFTKSQYEFLKIQTRTSDKTIKIRFRATANPGNIGHLWVKQRFIDDKQTMTVYEDDLGLTRMFIPAKVYDNPALTKSDPLYVKRLESLPEQDRKALLEGDWNIFVGQYFKEWRQDVHVIEPMYIPESWKRFISGDYGFKKPSSIGWYAVNPEGGVIRYREIYKEGLYYDELAELICEYSASEHINYCVFDPAIFGDKQHHSVNKDSREGESGAEIMQKVIRKWFERNNRPEDSFLITRADNRRIEGWRNGKQYLRINEDNETNFQVFSTCTNFITTFPANVHDDKKPEDLNTDGEDHTADEWRYGLMSRPPETVLNDPKELSIVSPQHKMLEARKRRMERTG